MSKIGRSLCFLLLVAPCAFAADSGDRPTTMRDQLTRILLEDSKGALQNEKSAAPARPAAPKANGAKPTALAPANAEPPRTDLWTSFTDTGIISAFHGKSVTRELTFGPCTDGELLNQRFFW